MGSERRYGSRKLQHGSPSLCRMDNSVSSEIALVQEVIDKHINSLLVAHRGSVFLEDILDGKAYITMSGGCQGCAMAKRTMQEFVLKVLMEHVPCIVEVVDVTNHERGTNPFFKKST